MTHALGGPELLLRSCGLRVTRPRLAVAAVLVHARDRGEHLTVAEVVERSAEIVGRLSPQTVYACLSALTEAGAVRRVDIPGAAARYEARLDGDDHHHHVCRRCGALHNVSASDPEAPRSDPAVASGVRIDWTEVVYWGLCAACARNA